MHNDAEQDYKVGLWQQRVMNYENVLHDARQWLVMHDEKKTGRKERRSSKKGEEVSTGERIRALEDSKLATFQRYTPEAFKELESIQTQIDRLRTEKYDRSTMLSRQIHELERHRLATFEIGDFRALEGIQAEIEELKNRRLAMGADKNEDNQHSADAFFNNPIQYSSDDEQS
eukprot:SAG11_NODE_5718_length_1480_cov_2.786387_1_plen_173_part_00